MPIERNESAKEHRVFWQWLADIHAESGGRSDLARDVLPRHLKSASSAKQAQLFNSYRALFDAANRLDMWEACSLISGSPCSDDSFEYFRNWLMWQGEDVYSRVVRSPDELADLINKKVIVAADPFFETLGLCATVGTEAGDPHVYSPACPPALPVAQFVPNFDWRESGPGTMARNLPKLWQMFGSGFKTVSDVLKAGSSQQTTSVRGLGELRVGDKVRHKFGYGVAVIKEVLVPETGTVLLEFEDGQRPMVLSADYFEAV